MSGASRATTSASAPAVAYEERRRRFRSERDACARRSGAIGRWRLLTFVAGAGLIAWSSSAGGAARIAALSAAAALGVAFLVLAHRHRLVREAQRRATVLEQLQEEGLARLARRWSALPATSAPPSDHAFARDLDVYGTASLRRILGPASPALGEPRLARWMLDASPTEAVRARQHGARELAPQVALRDALATNMRMGRPLHADSLERLLTWVEAPVSGAARGVVLWGSRALGLAASISLLAWLWRPVGPALWLAPAAVNVLITTLVIRRARRAFAEASGPASALSGVARSMRLIAGASFESPLLRERSAVLGHASDGGERRDDAATAIRRLGRLVALSELRHSPMMHAAVNAFTLLDVQVLAALDRWRERERAHARGWFDALGDIDALSALATLAHDEPSWSFPELIDAEPRIDARALGHPLLTDEARVANDVSLGPPGTFLLVTGSNMSGKSTLLRAIGSNVVLAQAGAPVCAAHMQLTPLSVRTSVRIEDSLERGISLFMAELLRLRDVVDAARAARRDGGRPVLFLLDEILHGTNTAERQIAARRILLRLVQEGAIGAVSTHDLALADHESLRTAARAVHFTEQFEPARDGTPARMTFDYVLRPGIATSVNAMRLVEMMGLG